MTTENTNHIKCKCVAKVTQRGVFQSFSIILIKTMSLASFIIFLIILKKQAVWQFSAYFSGYVAKKLPVWQVFQLFRELSFPKK